MSNQEYNTHRAYRYRSFLEPDREDSLDSVLVDMEVMPKGFNGKGTPDFDGTFEIHYADKTVDIYFFPCNHKPYMEIVKDVENYKKRLEILRRAIDTAQDAVEDYEREVELYYENE